MQAVPNKRHSDLLLEMCEQFLLADPYRVKFPNKKEFTYVPSDVTKKNRSRLDFFIISRDLLNAVTECSILPGLQNKLFDHHAVRIEFNAKKKIITPPHYFKTGYERPRNGISWRISRCRILFAL
jgi:exonuclease III